tara:strand:+ start:977 stop:1369 length:393 start_codon:yes stop_codon:yes gene_type:complete
MTFIQSIYDKKDEFFKRFGNEFFDKEFWVKLNQEQNTYFDATLCGFYNMVKARCDTDDNETSKIVYNSMKDKCKKFPSFKNFKKILDEKLNETGSSSFSNDEIEKGMKAFEMLYMQWEVKMLKEGFIENY